MGVERRDLRGAAHPETEGEMDISDEDTKVPDVLRHRDRLLLELELAARDRYLAVLSDELAKRSHWFMEQARGGTRVLSSCRPLDPLAKSVGDFIVWLAETEAGYLAQLSIELYPTRTVRPS